MTKQFSRAKYSFESMVDVAQLVEPLIVVQVVAGSSPVGHPIPSLPRTSRVSGQASAPVPLNAGILSNKGRSWFHAPTASLSDQPQPVRCAPQSNRSTRFSLQSLLSPPSVATI